MDRRNFFAKTVAGLVFGATSSKLFAENKPSKIESGYFATVDSGYFTLPYVPLTRTPVVLDKPTEWDKFANPISKHLENKWCKPLIDRNYKWFNKIVDVYDNNRFAIYTKYRQGGFSTLNVMYALRQMLKQHGTRVHFFCGQDRDAISLGQVFKRITEASDVACVKSSTYYFQLENGSHICFGSPHHSHIGRSCDYTFIDEAAFIPDMENHWKAMYPTLSAGARCFVYSTPNGAGGWFSDVYHNAIKEKNCFAIPPFIEATESFSEEILASHKEQLGDKAFYQEMMQSFV
ncbi:MAG: terminase large subunit domain-containing protein [Candidatus Thorarchaeota archaeon]|jgi:hypothetical protein